MARDNWSGRFGFVLAAAGSAVGLGNLWKFPYITWNNHGGAFVLVYLLCIAVVGLPIMCSEILIGRRAGASVSTAFARLGHSRWNIVGWLGVTAGFVILGFYVVIAGWSLTSFWQCLGWSFSAYEAPAEGAFGAFLGNGLQQLSLSLVFLVATALIVVRGISGGIELATKILMPVLFAILVYLVINVARLDGFPKALGFLFRPDFSQITPHGVLEALGHAFFTLSLGMGAMITYGSYLSKRERVVPTAATVVILDTVIALFACVIMFSIIFSVDGMEERVGKSTVGMLFVTLPELFYTKMPGGVVVGPLFYVLVAFAALSSTISLLEVIVSLFVDRFGWSRARATWVSTAGVYGLTALSALSLGASTFLTNVKLFGGADEGWRHWLNQRITGDKPGVLSILDHVSANWLLPLGGLMITLYVGWVMPSRDSRDEMFPDPQHGRRFYAVWFFFVRYVAPIAIGWIIYSVIAGDDFS